MSRWMQVALVVVLLPSLAGAADQVNALKKLPPPNVPALLAGNSPDALAGSLRGYLVHNLPTTLYEASPGWGRTKRVRRIEWKGGGLRVRPEVVYRQQNDGTWRKIRATAENLADTLVLDIRNFQQPAPGRLRFDIFLSFDLKLHYEQQVWESGIRLYSGSARARLRAKVLLRCELTARLEDRDSFLPDAVFRLRVVRAQLSYDNLVVEHIAGLGGEFAQLLGDAIKGSLDRWHPSLESELLAKASAAIVKAGDSKEVRLSVSKLLNRKAR
ncbi:MAG TPA: hypothetical protein VNK04_17125 [Gemmataceae bacterium]|nr:hypothetical protein [Gemmataceae bacterium]